MNFIHKSVALVFLMVSVYSCKQNSEKKDTDVQSVEQSVPEKSKNNEPSHFSLTLQVIIQKDDNLQLFYIQENTESYSVDRMLSQEVTGSDQFQDITFDMPMEFYPFNFRLDFGTNPIQSFIKIERCTLHYGSSEYTINGSEMKNYFVFNEGVEMLSDSITFKLKTFKEGAKDKYDPFVQGNLKLNDVLLKKL